MSTVPVVGVVTAMWKRHELTDFVFETIATIRKDLRNVIDLRPVVAGSEGERSRALALRHNFAYVEVPNSPLGAKWNAALNLLRHEPIDGVCIIGSDDLLNAAYYRMVAASIHNGEKLFGIDSFYILDRFSGRMFHWLGYPPPRDKEPIGLGRFIHRDYIESLNWALWEDDIEKGLDGSMLKRITALGKCADDGTIFLFKPTAEYGIMAVDIKHEQQMCMYEAVAGSSMHIRVSGDALAKLIQHFSPKLLARVFAPCPQRPTFPQDFYLPPWESISGQTTDIVSEIPMTELALATLPENPTEVCLPFDLRRNIGYMASFEAPFEHYINLLAHSSLLAHSYLP